MRLPDFITENIEPILAEWEAFARSIWPSANAGKLALRDHAEDILRATVRDMKSIQTATQQSDKSKGEGSSGTTSARVDGASDIHAVARVRSGFDLQAVVAEYRALRASVIRLWIESGPTIDKHDQNDLIRFNESMDQSLSVAVRSYTLMVDRSRQMFLAILGHDLRNPLTSIMMSAELLITEGKLDAESSDVASRISGSGAAMSQMINDLLDFTGSTLGAAMPIRPDSLDLGKLCEEVAGEIRAANPDRTLNFQAHGDLTGQWDAPRLRQVISNLLGNAVQHGAEKSPIELTAISEGSDVQFLVQNTSRPIPADALPTIFEPLVRATLPGAQGHRRAGSIGLGLFIAREIVIAHGGTIAVSSSPEGITVFTVRLPRCRAAAA